MGRHGEMGEKKGMIVSSLRDFGAGRNQYFGSHLFKGDAASISSSWTMELALSLMAKAERVKELKVQVVSQAYRRSKCGLGIGCKFVDSLSNNELSDILFIDFCFPLCNQIMPRFVAVY